MEVTIIMMMMLMMMMEIGNDDEGRGINARMCMYNSFNSFMFPYLKKYIESENNFSNINSH